MSLNQNSLLKVLLLSHITLLFLISFANCQYFRKTPRTIYFEHQGLNLELPCITEKREVWCSWLKNGTVVRNNNKYSYSVRSGNGDCSLTIHNLGYPKDSTIWECQVDPLSETVDNIRWPSTTVVVLVKPSPPRITNDKLNSAITAERITNITCVSEGGNPLPTLEWTLNGENITANATTTINDKTVTSTLSYTFRKKNNGSTLVCNSVHQTENQNFSHTLDVFYKPQVSVAQKMYTVLDGKDLEIDCKVDANPPAKAYWKPNVVIDDSKYLVSGNKLILRKLSHNLDGVVFQCSAQNTVGTSEPESIKLNVLFQPRLVETSNSHHKISLGGEIRLECKFIGNPKPVIKWNFIDSINKDLVNPEASPENPGLLVINNATYLNEGDYYCDGINHDTFLNKDNIARSNKFVVDISGKPYFLNQKQIEIGYRGMNTRIEKLFCSDPFPTSVYWSYGAMRLDVDLASKVSKEEFPDDNLDSFHIKAGRLISLDPQSPNPTCFSAALIVSNTDIDDKRDYVIVVQNSYGTSEGIITLMVSSPLSGAILISIALIILIMLFALTVLAILIMRRRSNNKRDVEVEIKSEVPKTESSNVVKPDNGKNIEDNYNQHQLYANLDIVGNDDNRAFRTTDAEPTEYARISFDN